jgi:hypothetical protein
MATNNLHEEWRTVQFDFEYTNDLRLEISSHGRIRSFSKAAEGRLLKGTMINGYRIVRIKLFKPRTEKNTKRFEYLKDQILKLTKQVTPLVKELKEISPSDERYAKHKQQVDETNKLLEAMKLSYKKERRKEELKRTINLGMLVHRLVAQYFVPQPTEKHTLAAHIDHDKLNNHVSNIKWMTQEENTAHQQKSPAVIADKKKRIGLRRNAKNYKLTENRVMLIKKRINEGVKLRLLAKQFKVTETQLLRIKRGINWADIPAAS